MMQVYAEAKTKLMNKLPTPVRNVANTGSHRRLSSPSVCLNPSSDHTNPLCEVQTKVVTPSSKNRKEFLLASPFRNEILRKGCENIRPSSEGQKEGMERILRHGAISPRISMFKVYNRNGPTEKKSSEGIERKPLHRLDQLVSPCVLPGSPPIVVRHSSVRKTQSIDRLAGNS